MFEDLDNVSRPQGNGFDIGGYEYTGTTEVVEEHIPLSFELFQNYPNPFNPTTTIKYQIPERNFVSIKVFDILGNEIKTLVDEEMSAGNYEVKFNAAYLSSSVYIYQLIAGNYIQTRKMLVLK